MAGGSRRRLHLAHGLGQPPLSVEKLPAPRRPRPHDAPHPRRRPALPPASRLMAPRCPPPLLRTRPARPREERLRMALREGKRQGHSRPRSRMEGRLLPDRRPGTLAKISDPAGRGFREGRALRLQQAHGALPVYPPPVARELSVASRPVRRRFLRWPVPHVLLRPHGQGRRESLRRKLPGTHSRRPRHSPPPARTPPPKPEWDSPSASAAS